MGKCQPNTMLSAPGLTVFDPEKGASDATTALAVVCATWLEDVGVTDFQAPRGRRRAAEARGGAAAKRRGRR